MLRAFYASKEWATWAYGGLALLIGSSGSSSINCGSALGMVVL